MPLCVECFCVLGNGTFRYRIITLADVSGSVQIWHERLCHIVRGGYGGYGGYSAGMAGNARLRWKLSSLGRT